MKNNVVNLLNKNINEIEIPDSIFNIKVFPDIIHQYIRYQNAKSRLGSHKTKNRSEVSGRSKKPFAQKGTGNARQGSSKPPHFRGGAVSMGPHNRDHSFFIYPILIVSALTNSYLGTSIFQGAGPFLILPEVS